MPVIPAFGRQRQEDYRFKAKMGFQQHMFLGTTTTTTTTTIWNKNSINKKKI